MGGWVIHFPGKITKVNSDGTFGVTFEDGENKNYVEEREIKKAATGKIKLVSLSPNKVANQALSLCEMKTSRKSRRKKRPSPPPEQYDENNYEKNKKENKEQETKCEQKNNYDHVKQKTKMKQKLRQEEKIKCSIIAQLKDMA